MKEYVSFSKEIEFKNMLSKITSISLEHTLSIDENSNIKGDLIVQGTYKQVPISQIDTPFSYKIPIDITIDEKYNLDDLIIDIDDFTYEILDDKYLKINVNILLDKLKLKEERNDDEIISVEDLFLEKEEVKPLEIEEKKDEKEEIPDKKEETSEIVNSDSLFAHIDGTNETYKAYKVYIMRQDDTINTILEKYHVKKEDLEEYNNLQEIKIGSKVIIPNNEEDNKN